MLCISVNSSLVRNEATLVLSTPLQNVPNSMLHSANSPLKQGHPSNQDALIGPKGGRIRGSPLYYPGEEDDSLFPCFFSLLVQALKQLPTP